jgi:Icc-related predicted phosphoesterase
VREAIERYQPPLALFGHIHEGRGIAKIGKTLCINPGSSYEQGVLLGTVVDFDGHRIANHTLTSG